MTVMTVAYFELKKDYVDPNFRRFINHYKDGNTIQLPPFHGCAHRNKNETRKFINYANGYQYVTPSWQRYWKENIKSKYKTKNGFCYWTRYMNQTRNRYLFKNEGYFIYNCKLKTSSFCAT